MASTLFLTALAATAACAQAFPKPGGPYAVQWTNKELVDAGRLDPFNSSHTRRIMISHFSPVEERHCKKTCRVPYFLEDVATIEDEILAAAFEDFGWPLGLIGKLEMDVCCEVTKAGKAKAKKLPTVLLGSGLNTTRLFYSGFATEIASAGLNVITIDHPYETDVVQFPDGEIIFGGHVVGDPTNLGPIEFGLRVRDADVAFLLERLGIRKTLYVGHSYGGASALSATRNVPRVKAGMNLDGGLWGPVVETGVSKPFINFSGGENSTVNDSWKAFYEAQEQKHPGVWGREMHLDTSTHGSFWDLSLIADFTGLRENKDLVEYVIGPETGTRVAEVLRAYVSDYAKFSLLGAGEGLLAGESEAFPDVHFIR
ncbi:Alpha/Beta hydrolase protein [Xylariaceae sp. FL0594]|nr:Alpha/Beta hydrolase protein [Xylariaceae sp. FL0594]